MKFSEIKQGMTLTHEQDVKFGKTTLYTVAYVDNDGFLIKWQAANGATDTYWEKPSSAPLFFELVEPLVDLTQEYWLNKRTGKVVGRVQPWHKPSGWTKNCHRVRFTGFEAVE
jgi:hypothetical protein